MKGIEANSESMKRVTKLHTRELERKEMRERVTSGDAIFKIHIRKKNRFRIITDLFKYFKKEPCDESYGILF